MKQVLILIELLAILLCEINRELIPHTYEEIAKEINELKTSWKAKAYRKNYKPLLGAILEVLLFDYIFNKKIFSKNL